MGASQHPPSHRGYIQSMSLNLLSFFSGCMTLAQEGMSRGGCSPSPTGGMQGFLLSHNYHTRVIKFQLLGVYPLKFQPTRVSFTFRPCYWERPLLS